MGQKSRDLDNLVSGMDDITLFVMKIIFVVIVISITHALYTWCTKGSKSSKTTRSASSSTGAPKAMPKASSTASSPQASAPPEPPAYDSIYPDLSKELNAAKKSSGGGGGGLFSWLFGSGGDGNGARDLVFQRIADQFYSVDEVSNAIRQSGLESSNLLFGKHE